MSGSLPCVNTKRRSSDLVWDGGLHATAFVDDGAPLLAGVDVGWTPDLLAATAVGTELMTLVLRQASEAGIEILGYVSEQRLMPPNGRPATILVAPCVSVMSRAAANALEPILRDAVDAILRHRPAGELLVEPHVSIVSSRDRRF